MQARTPPSPHSIEPASRPASLACESCRRSHLKCDEKRPVCSRCLTRGHIQCSYTPSRRGVVKSRPNQRQRPLASGPAVQRVNLSPESPRIIIQYPQILLPDHESMPNFSADPVAAVYALTSDRRDSVENAQRFSNNAELDGHVHTRSSHQLLSPSSNQEEIHNEHFINLFYTHFHLAHPILVPRSLYASRKYPNHLRHIVHFIGSHFSTSIAGKSLSAIAAEAVADESQRVPSMVQARLLYAIALHARNELVKFQSVLQTAVELAIGLGMNEQEFASINGSPHHMEQESLRRTWWELYVVDSYMAAFWRKSRFISKTIALDAGLPCDAAFYVEGSDIPESPSLAQFNRRIFTDDETNYSSFCYRIEAARILGRVLELTGSTLLQHGVVMAVDSALAGWVHHLSPAKAEIINEYGEMDEMLFQAHMIIHCASLILHFPRSNVLHTLGATAEITGRQGAMHTPPTSTQHSHTIKAFEASKQLSNLAALRSSIHNHSPFFICGLVLAATVQLSACSVHVGKCIERHQDRVALAIGILKSLSRTWPYAEVVLRQLKKVAAEVLGIGESRCTATGQSALSSNDQYAINFDRSWLDTLDIQAFQNLMNFDFPIVDHQPF